jgi:methylmalonyl-CoA/ethylmalonyl-CoA epimerase
MIGAFGSCTEKSRTGQAALVKGFFPYHGIPGGSKSTRLDAPIRVTAMNLRFHHVGYAVDDIDLYVEEYFSPLFTPKRITPKVADPIQRVTVCFAEMHGGVTIELVEPLGSPSPVDSVVGSRRGGIYHLCYECEDLEEAVSHFRVKRCLPLSRPTPAAAFQGRRIVFLLTPQHDLIELLEQASG